MRDEICAFVQFAITPNSNEITVIYSYGEESMGGVHARDWRGIDRKLFQDIHHKMLRQETFCTLQMDEYVEDETKIFLFNLII
jgi:hypothetical protein